MDYDQLDCIGQEIEKSVVCISFLIKPIFLFSPLSHVCKLIYPFCLKIIFSKNGIHYYTKEVKASSAKKRATNKTAGCVQNLDENKTKNLAHLSCKMRKKKSDFYSRI